uniref:Uncharacterized protein n=1 Tax=Vitis vinifera TaxID=29760 RepID=A5BY51_VITVI|nr:hypothetical protein VITISV_008868 [Vitis vinifera]
MDMEILNSGGGEGSDVDGITSGVSGVVGGVEGVTSGIGSIEGTARVGALMLAGISTGYGSFGCFGYGISGCSGLVGVPGSAPYAIILAHFLANASTLKLRLGWISQNMDCHSRKDEFRLDNPLDGLARRDCAGPLLCVWLPEYHDIRQW